MNHRYSDYICCICNNQFQNEDDIVVCPDCGTPYHRDCWNTVNHCINSQLHNIDDSWQKVQNRERLVHGGFVCPNCDHVNKPNVEKCAICDSILYETDEDDIEDKEPSIFGETLTNIFMGHPDSDIYEKISSDECIQDISVKDISTFVGKNSDYYIPRFKFFSKSNKKLSFNFSCYIFPSLYFAYRKMWFMLFITTIITILEILPNHLHLLYEQLTSPSYAELLQEIGRSISDYENLISFLRQYDNVFKDITFPVQLFCVILKLIISLYGNYIYYNHTIKTIKYVKQSNNIKILSKIGGTSILNVFLFCIFYILIINSIDSLLLFIFK